MGIDLFDCAIPTRLARHGTALAPDPDGRFRIDLTKSAYADDDGPVVEGCPCEACTRHSRAYLRYLARNKDLTGTRLLTLHNLTFMERLAAGAREAIGAGAYGDYARAVVGGAAPWEAVGELRH
jgi:queuine tRNA-ribosyltransferase